MIVGSSVGVREAHAGDHAQLTRSLVDAFMDDPVAKWAAGHGAARERMLTRFFRVYLTAKQRHDTVWTDDQLSGAALWLPPGHTVTTIGEDLALVPSMLHWRLIARAPLVGWGLAGVERKHPKRPEHFYLAAIGVSRAGQGQGVGAALMRPVLDICDRDGVPAYLEASKYENVAYYARHGFRQGEAIRLPRGPLIYPMWREPR